MVKKHKQKKHKLKFIMMTCGYVESSMVSTLVFGCNELGRQGFATHAAAITDLALDMYAKYIDEVSPIKPKQNCCMEFLQNKMAKNSNFCPTCGASLKDDEFDAERFCEFVKGLHSTDTDGYGEAECCSGRDLVWWPWAHGDVIGAKKDEVVYIAEDAEHILLAALFDEKPELKTGDFLLGEWQVEKWEAFKKGKPPTYR